MSAPTYDELVQRLTAWRDVRRVCAPFSEDPVEAAEAQLADALLADFADRLVGLGVAK